MPTNVGDEILNEVAAFIRRYVVLSEEQLMICALWSAATHTMGVFDVATYLNISSAEKQCGKTRLLELLSLVVNKPWYVGRVTPAVLVRKISASRPTLLLDESDNAFKGDKEYTAALAGILNQGYRRGIVVSLCVGKGSNQEPTDFDVFGPKAFGGIGTMLPDTVQDRSIPVRLRRKGREEVVERFRWRVVTPLSKRVREPLANWVASITEELRDYYPELPNELTDRQQEAVEGLIAIADLAGGKWPMMARRALIALFRSASAEDQSISVQLLLDIRQAFIDKNQSALWSEEIVEYLKELEGREWGEWGKSSKPISQYQVAKLLKRYREEGVKEPTSIRKGETVRRGYYAEWFEDAWNRYLPPLRNGSDPVCSGPWKGSSATVLSNNNAGCSGVALGSGGMQERTLPSCTNCGSFAVYKSPTGAVSCQTCEAPQ